MSGNLIFGNSFAHYENVNWKQILPTDLLHESRKFCIAALCGELILSDIELDYEDLGMSE